MCRAFALALALVLSAITGFAAEKKPDVLFDVNDLSVLFPFDKDRGRFVPHIPMGDLVPEPLFNDIKTVAKEQAGITFADSAGKFTGEGDLRKWVIVGFRFDPCAPTWQLLLPDEQRPAEIKFAVSKGLLPDGCLYTFRLVAQPVVNGIPADFTAHLVYLKGVWKVDKNMTQIGVRGFGSSVDRMRKGLNLLAEFKTKTAAVGVQTDGYPLGVHPGLAAAMGSANSCPGSSPSCALIDFARDEVVKGISPAVPSSIAFMGLGGHGPEPWVFMPGRVRPCGERKACWIPSQVNGLRPGQAREGSPRPGQFVSFTSREDRVIDAVGGVPLASNLHTDHLFNLQNPIAKLGGVPIVEAEGEGGLLPGRRIERHEGTIPVKHVALALNHPGISNPINTDCVSCHTVASRIWALRIYPKKEAIEKGIFYEIPAGVTGYLSAEAVPRGFWNVRNFGYFGTRPSISTRSLFETVEVVSKVNRFNGFERDGNGVDCGERSWEVYNCTLNRAPQCFAKAGCRGLSKDYVRFGADKGRGLAQ